MLSPSHSTLARSPLLVCGHTNFANPRTDSFLLGQTLASLQADLLDIHNQRLSQMDANGVDFVHAMFYHSVKRLIILFRWFSPADRPAYKEYPTQQPLQKWRFRQTMSWPPPYQIIQLGSEDSPLSPCTMLLRPRRSCTERWRSSVFWVKLLSQLLQAGRHTDQECSRRIGE